MSDASNGPTQALAPRVPDYSTLDVWRFGPVRRLLVSNFVLFAGVALQAVAIQKQAFDISGRESDIGFIGLAEFLPAALLVLVTGSVADRFNRRVVALWAVGFELLSSVALLLYAASDPTSVFPLFLISFGYGVARAFQAPAMRSMPPMVAPDGGLPRTIALFSATWTAAMIVGPALSGFLYAVDPWVAYLGSSTFILAGWVGIVAVRFVRTPEPPDPDQRPTLHSAMEGLRFIRRTPILFAAISLDLFAVLFGGAVALLPAIAEERLHVGDIAYGWLRAAPGIGAAAMAVFIATRPVRRHVGIKLLAVVGVFGAATIVLGITRSYVVAFVALIVLSAADMVSVFIRSSLVPLVTPDEKRGRVLAVENVFIGASNELGAFESGVVAQQIGSPATVIGGGAATLVVVATWAFAFPSLRDVDTFDELDHTRSTSSGGAD
ncbi:MAG: MFS transporter [Actinobacteria bacterium]|nr:MFS transporter [Actinomycetota bacterium]